MVDILEISGIVAAAGVLVGVVYYILDMRNQSKQRQTEIETRQANLFMQIYDKYCDEDFLKKFGEVTYRWTWKDYDDFKQKYGLRANPEAFAKFDSVGTYFKGVGVLLKKGLVDLDLVDELMGTSIKQYWEKVGSVAMKIRVGFPHCLEGVEYLYNELKKREQQLQKS